MMHDDSVGFRNISIGLSGRLGVIGLIAGLAAILLGEPVRAGPSEDLPDLEGHWAKRIVQVTVSDPPILGKYETKSVQLMDVEIEQDGRDLVVHSDTCSVTLHSEGSPLHPHLPRAFYEAIPDFHRSGRIVDAEDGYRVEIDSVVSVLGARLRQKKSENLPTSPDDPRVVDDDKDGHRCRTFSITGFINGETYVVQRGWDSFDGRLVSSNRIVGDVNWNADQSVLDATNFLLKTQPASKPHPNSKKHRFVMVRVPKEIDCDYLNKHDEKPFED